MNTADHERYKVISEAWKTPVCVVWIACIALLLAFTFIVAPLLNPNAFDPRYHLVVTAEGEAIPAENAVDHNGLIHYSAWKDPKTGRVFSVNSPEIMKAERKTKWGHAIITLLCALPIVLVYRHRQIALGWLPDHVRSSTRWHFGIACVIAALSYFAPAVDLAQIVISRSHNSAYYE